MARAGMIREIVEVRYPLYDADLKAIIAKVYAANRGRPDVDERLIDALWQEGYSEFRARNIEASRGDADELARAKRGELTPAGREAIRAYLDEAQDFDESLLELSDVELAARHDEICGTAEAAGQAKRREQGLQADRLAFFSRANAAADFAHWRALPVWSAEEVTALSFGKDPRRVNVASLRAYTCLHGSPFRDDFMARLDWIERAVRSRQLREPLKLAVFLKWAVSHGIELPPELTSGSATHRGLNEEIDVREVHTLYKVLLGLAIKHYNYDPTLPDGDEQTGVFGPMKNDLEEVAADTSIPTLRKTLKQARAWAILKPQPLVARFRRVKAVTRP